MRDVFTTETAKEANKIKWAGYVNPPTKVCSRCLVEKDRGEFCLDKRRRSSVCSWCYDCMAEHRRKEN